MSEEQLFNTDDIIVITDDEVIAKSDDEDEVIVISDEETINSDHSDDVLSLVFSDENDDDNNDFQNYIHDEDTEPYGGSYTPCSFNGDEEDTLPGKSASLLLLSQISNNKLSFLGQTTHLGFLVN